MSNENNVSEMPDTFKSLGDAAVDVTSRLRAIIPYDGKKISADGVYDMPIEAYHSDCCVGHSVSSSGLRRIDSRSPLHYWDESYMNPDREEFKKSASMILGSAAHHVLLGEEGFASKFVVRPLKLDGEAWNGNKTICKQWLAAKEKEGLTVLTPDQVIAVRGMAAQLAKHPLIKSGLMSGAVEKSLIWKDKETGIWLKARPDIMPIYGDMIADYKTANDASLHELERKFPDFGYHVQLALVGMGVEALFGHRPADDSYSLIYSETTRPYPCTVQPVDPEAIGAGRMIVRRALRKLAKCIETDEWPGYDTDMMTVSLPKWYRDRIEREVKDGFLDASAA